jgi:hypothetical protein
MSGDWPLHALVVAPAPVSKTADWIASFVPLLALSVVVASRIVRHILGALALNREWDQSLDVDEPVEMN